MPSFVYVGDDERYYPEQGVHAAPGVTATFDSKPDDLWASASSKRAQAVKTDDPTPAAPAADTTSQA